MPRNTCDDAPLSTNKLTFTWYFQKRPTNKQLWTFSRINFTIWILRSAFSSECESLDDIFLGEHTISLFCVHKSIWGSLYFGSQFWSFFFFFFFVHFFPACSSCLWGFYTIQFTCMAFCNYSLCSAIVRFIWDSLVVYVRETSSNKYHNICPFERPFMLFCEKFQVNGTARHCYCTQEASRWSSKFR